MSGLGDFLIPGERYTYRPKVEQVVGTETRSFQLQARPEIASMLKEILANEPAVSSVDTFRRDRLNVVLMHGANPNAVRYAVIAQLYWLYMQVDDPLVSGKSVDADTIQDLFNFPKEDAEHVYVVLSRRDIGQIEQESESGSG